MRADLFGESPGHGGLPAAGVSADECQPDGSGGEVIRGDLEVPGGVVGRLRPALQEPHTIDLGPYPAR